MIKADLHVHSKHSQHPSEWFLQKIGTRESYTEVEDVYQVAKARGMDYVTLTDHNTIGGALELVKRHPHDCFVSAEITTYFPEDGCKVHVLVYDITPQQFTSIDACRRDIYALRDLLRREHIAHSVAHATYSVNSRLTLDTVEKLILLFDVFEGVNGARNRLYNQAWVRLLQDLTPADMERIHAKHGIEPWGPDSWIKGFTGGSDDHAGLMIGETFTVSNDATVSQLMRCIKARETLAQGRHGDHKSLAFAVYKIAYEFSRHRTGNGGDGLFSVLNSLLFDEGRLGFKNWIAVQRLRMGKDSRNQALMRFFDRLSEGRPGSILDADGQVSRVYEGLAGLTDDFFSMVVTSLEKDLRNGDAARLFKNFSSALPVMFLIAPFMSTMRHMHHDRQLLTDLDKAFGRLQEPCEKSILWFSDTVIDLNGVSVTMRALAQRAHETNRPMKLVTSLADHEDGSSLPPNTINLPCIYSVTPEFYAAYTVRVPSMLRSIDMITREQPDDIVISTPGPVGLLGLATARLLGIPCTGIYHTDFAKQADFFIGDPWVSAAVETYTRNFFRLLDTVRVPTEQYINMLVDRGLDRSKMSLFRRGIEEGFTSVQHGRQEELMQRFGLDPEADILMWAGRLGKEKNLDFMMDIYRRVAAKRGNLQFLIVGDGPELERLRSAHGDDPHVIFPGRVERTDLPNLYSLADVFVFPSTTDTFGMVVLEAQACGLPAVVTDVGGPQEIVRDGETGFVLPADQIEKWEKAIAGLLDMKHGDAEDFARMKEAARHMSHSEYGWDSVLDQMMGTRPEPRTTIEDRGGNARTKAGVGVLAST